MKDKKTLPIVAAVVLVLCAGVLFLRKPSWKATSYTIPEIKAMAARVNDLDNVTDDDCTRKALKAYNIMLGYAENEAKFEYKVYDFYHVNFSSVKSYVIKLISKADADALVDGEELKIDDPRIVMITCSERGTKVKSEIEPKLMARRWISDLSAETAALIPSSHVNGDYISLDYIVPNVKSEKYTDRSDYTHFFKKDFYEKKRYVYYTNNVNVMLPPGTPEESVQHIYRELLPTLKKYCICNVMFLAPKDAETMEKLISEEKISDNSYYKVDGIEWRKSYSVIRDSVVSTANE